MEEIKISNELHERLQKERKDFEETIGIEFNIEQTIWELLKIVGIFNEEAFKNPNIVRKIQPDPELANNMG